MGEFKGSFNIYCDESCHLINDGKPYMVFGYISVPLNKIKVYNSNLILLKDKHRFKRNIKWVDVANNRKQFYSKLIDYVFTTDMVFKSIIVKKWQDGSVFNDLNKYDEYFISLYERLVFNNLDLNYVYNIFFDKVDSLKSQRINQLKKTLKISHSFIKNIQIISSKESRFMQICDLLIGIISYKLRDLYKKNNSSPTKKLLLDKIDLLFNNSIDNAKLKLTNTFDTCFIEFSKNAIQSHKSI